MHDNNEYMYMYICTHMYKSVLQSCSIQLYSTPANKHVCMYIGMYVYVSRSHKEEHVLLIPCSGMGSTESHAGVLNLETRLYCLFIENFVAT